MTGSTSKIQEAFDAFEKYTGRKYNLVETHK